MRVTIGKFAGGGRCLILPVLEFVLGVERRDLRDALRAQRSSWTIVSQPQLTNTKSCFEISGFPLKSRLSWRGFWKG